MKGLFLIGECDIGALLDHLDLPDCSSCDDAVNDIVSMVKFFIFLSFLLLVLVPIVIYGFVKAASAPPPQAPPRQNPPAQLPAGHLPPTESSGVHPLSQANIEPMQGIIPPDYDVNGGQINLSQFKVQEDDKGPEDGNTS